MSKSIRIFLIILVFLTFPVGNKEVFAAMSEKKIENMTWEEVEAQQKNNPLVIIPLGAAAKEHGLHLPMNNDYIMANYLRDRVLVEMSNVLALPTVNYSYYPSFLEYPGSTSIAMNHAAAMLADICRSLAGQGFKKFYILNTGYSTIKALEIAKQQLASENIDMDYLQPPEFFNSEAIRKLKQQKLGSHADEIETSMMLYIAPEIVRMNKAIADEHPSLSSGGLSRNSQAKTGVYSPTGAWGNPSLVSKEKGKMITESYLRFILDKMTTFKNAH